MDPSLDNQKVNYLDLASQAPTDGGVRGLIDYLISLIPFHWQLVYSANTRHQPNFIRFESGGYLYLFDHYSALEPSGEVAIDQSVQDRVIGVLGRSAPRRAPRRGRRRTWAPPPEELAGAERDQGHFMAHTIGGGLEINIFSQSRTLNQGRSAQGKCYREMERYCRLHAGTLCFARPIYADGTSVPRWLEFGLVREDGSLWVEFFDN